MARCLKLVFFPELLLVFAFVLFFPWPAGFLLVLLFFSFFWSQLLQLLVSCVQGSENLKLPLPLPNHHLTKLLCKHWKYSSALFGCWKTCFLCCASSFFTGLGLEFSDIVSSPGTQKPASPGKRKAFFL